MLTEAQKKYIEEEKKKDPKFKTELCKTYSLIGSCKYGYKCRFAHGKEELVPKIITCPFYNQRICKAFMEKGYCAYGERCNYKHNSGIYDKLPMDNQIPLIFSAASVFYKFNRLKVFKDLTEIKHVN